MEEKDDSISSQTFFVSQRTKNNKLSLKSKQNVSQENLGDQNSSVSFLRSGALETNLPAMEKYLERECKSTKPTCKKSLNQNVKPSICLLDKKKSNCVSEPIDLFKKPPTVNCTFNPKETKSGIVSIKTVFGKESETVYGDSDRCIPNDHCDKSEDSMPIDNIGECSLRENNQNQHIENTVNSDSVVSKKDGTKILLCPLCWKSFECKDSQFSHMKACALKHKVSTKQLLDALELIQRQETERQALGLPLLACKIPRKAKKDSLNSSIRPKNASDGRIQLALALSASLSEAEKQRERDHLLEAGLFNEVEEKGLLPTQEIEESHSVPPAPIFLNVGKKSSDSARGLPKTRKKNPRHNQEGRITTLLKRKAEDRERLITDKVAIILVGDDNVNSRNYKSLGGHENYPIVWEIESEELKKYLNKESILWKMASLSPSNGSKNHYYVDSLSCLISPSRVTAGSKLKHLSQIPGRNNSPVKPSILQMDDKGNGEKMEINSPTVTKCYLHNDSVVSCRKQTVKKNLFVKCFEHAEQNTLSQDWGVLVGKSEFSDITIYTREDHKIAAHKLVFYVRCPNILKDLVKEETENGCSSDLLIWAETCFLAALEFLKYIYSGVISEVMTLKETVLEDLNALAEKYYVKELLGLLEKTHNSSVVHENYLVKNLNDPSPREANNSNFILEKNHSELSENPERSEFHQPEVESSFNRKDDYFETIQNKEFNSCSFSPAISVIDRSSPDIFQATNLYSPDSPKSVVILEEKPEKTERSGSFVNSSQDSRESIEYLVSLMENESSLDNSSNNNLKSPKCNDSLVDEGGMFNKITVNSNISEAPTLLNENVSYENFTEPDMPKTPLLNNDTHEFIVYSTPAPRKTITSKDINEQVTEKELGLSKDKKRKCMSSDGSDTSTPIPKKMCVTENKNPGNVESNNTTTDEKEVVDLTLSCSETEETAGKYPNESDISTIPPPDYESLMLSPVGEKTASNCNLNVPCETSYISNVWDDFDYVPDAHHMALEKSLDEVCGGSPRCSIVKGSEDLGDAIISPVRCEKVSPDKVVYMTDKLSNITPQRINENPNPSIVNDNEELENNLSSPRKSDQASPEKDADITDKLLNASLQRIDASIFWRDENEPIELHGEKCNPPKSHQTPIRVTHLNELRSKNETPTHCSKSNFLSAANITPLADYSSMKTPMLHKELNRYGIKHLKRNQAKQILRHIYNELHPVVSAGGECSDKTLGTADGQNKMEKNCDKFKNKLKENQAANKKKITFESLDSNSDEFSSSQESSDSSSDSVILEESMYEQQFESPVKNITLSQKVSSVDIPTAMKNLIENNPTLHRKILLYEPIWLDEIKMALKENGAKFNVNQLMNYLDEQCVTFRLAQGNRHQKRRKTSKKKIFSLSQPCNQKGKNKAPISNSQPC